MTYLPSIRVNQIDPNTNEVVATYKSMNEASRETDINVQNIWQAVHSNTRTAGGYIWRKAE